MTTTVVEVLLGWVFLVGALLCRQSLRRCILGALCMTCGVMALLPSLNAPSGAAGSAARVIAAVVCGMVAAFALLLLADGLLLVRRLGLAAPQAVTFVAGLALAAVLGLIVFGAVRGGTALVTASLSLGIPTAYVTALFACFLGLSKLGGHPWSRRPADCVIVLGAGLDDGEVTPLLADRLDRAVAVYRTLVARGADPVFIVSGGQGADEERSEAEAMFRYAVEHGVPASRVKRENHSHNTDQNLTYSAVLMRRTDSGEGRVTVVTSDFHVLRATLIMERLGLRGRVVGARTSPAYWVTATTREFVAVIWFDRRMSLVLSALLLLPALALLLPWRR